MEILARLLFVSENTGVRQSEWRGGGGRKRPGRRLTARFIPQQQSKRPARAMETNKNNTSYLPVVYFRRGKALREGGDKALMLNLTFISI